MRRVPNPVLSQLQAVTVYHNDCYCFTRWRRCLLHVLTSPNLKHQAPCLFLRLRYTTLLSSKQARAGLPPSEKINTWQRIVCYYYDCLQLMRSVLRPRMAVFWQREIQGVQLSHRFVESIIQIIATPENHFDDVTVARHRHSPLHQHRRQSLDWFRSVVDNTCIGGSCADCRSPSDWRSCCTCGRCMASLQCAGACAPSDGACAWRLFHTCHTWTDEVLQPRSTSAEE